MQEQAEKALAIGSDAPQTTPDQDAFGYAGFSQTIATAIQKVVNPQGLVMAIHGPWGSGKSTFLNFVRHYLEQLPESERPVVIDFNPWWFNDRDHLASQFLNQFYEKLPHESRTISKIGDALADYSEAIGVVIENVNPYPWMGKHLGKIISSLLKGLRSKPKDVPTLKAKVAKELQNQSQRFVFIIDDIDRLTPDEIRELFKVVKALADFPNVIYLLAFDRQVVTDALRTSLGVDGEAYLEKIVQAPFTLPAVRKDKLRERLSAEITRLLGTPEEGSYSESYLNNIYLSGLDQLIQKPRDIIRIVNNLSILYPRMRGEVNPVDFFAIEFLHVFLPGVYEVIRDNKGYFAGHAEQNGFDKKIQQEFHDAWLNEVHIGYRNGIKDLIRRLFPKLDAVWGNTFYHGDYGRRWRRELRVSSPDLFPIYFELGVGNDRLSRQEINAFLKIANDPDIAAKFLLAAIDVKRPDGSTKMREYLDRLRDLSEEISPEVAKSLLTVIGCYGDDLLRPEDQVGGMFAIPPAWRLVWAAEHLLEQIAPDMRESTLVEIIQNGNSLRFSSSVILAIEEAIQKQINHGSAVVLTQISDQTISHLKTIVVSRFRQRAVDGSLLHSRDLIFLLYRWREWATLDEVRAWINDVLKTDDGTLQLLVGHLTFTQTQGFDDYISRQVPSLNPKYLKPYTDLDALESRVRQLAERPDLSGNQKLAIREFLAGMERIHQGKDTDDPFWAD